MVGGTESAEPFKGAIGLFFILVLLGLGIAAVSDAPLSFDGAFFLFSVLDHHRFAAFHGRPINVLLQAPTLAATHFTENTRVLRLIFCSAYALVPALGLTASWLVCRSRRPALFFWPAISMCLAALPGQFSFQSESIMAVTLLWPTLLAVLVGTSALGFSLVATMAVAAALSHPYAAISLAFTMPVAIVSAIIRPQARKAYLWLALALGAVLIARVVAPLDKDETSLLSVHTVVRTWRDSVFGWPLVAIAFTCVLALICLGSGRSFALNYLIVPVFLAGVALVAWAISPAHWMKCNDYRYWVAPISLIFMVGATLEVLGPVVFAGTQQQGARFSALPGIGLVFLVVLSIQSLYWGRMSRRLTSDLMYSDRGCVSGATVPWINNTAMDHWSVIFDAIDLQGRKPRTLLLPHDRACQTLALTGDAILVDQGAFQDVRHPHEGWFDFDDARSRTGKPGN